MTTFELLSVAIAAVSLVVSTVVLLFLLMQIRLLRAQVEDSRAAQVKANRQAEIQNGRLRQRATMEFTAGTMSKVHDLYNQLPAAGSPLQDQFLAAAMVRDSNEFTAVPNYLNYMEDLSVGINMNISTKTWSIKRSEGR